MRSKHAFLVLMALSGGLLMGQNTPAKPVAPDNTKVNQRDRVEGAVTADQAKNNKPDREIMRDIRKSVVDDKSLSTYAHNVKIVSEHGKVTLKGPVRSEDESRTINSKAEQVAGAGNVVNQLSIKPESGKGTASRTDTTETKTK